MFFIMGVNQAQKQIEFFQTVVCECCGSYGRYEIFVHYSYFSFFFIPIFKWNKHYYVKMSCCNAECEIDKDLGKAIERGEIASLNPENLHFGGGNHSNKWFKRCRYCGFTTEEDYAFCPKCGRQL